jgi:hypothetical protein
MKKNKNIINEYEDDYNGQKVIVHKFKSKKNKIVNITRSNFAVCPNCLSKMVLDNKGFQQCSGDRLVTWVKEFQTFKDLDDIKKVNYIKNLSHDSMFLELYDRWHYSQSNPEDIFNCGYTNQIFLPIPNCSVIIPDPTQIKRIEKKLGRKLTEEEIFGEKELFAHRGGIFEEYRDGARIVKISLLRFPEDCY